MKASAKLDIGNGVDLTVSVTMPVADWRTFQAKLAAAKLDNEFPFWKMSRIISKSVEKALDSFDATDEID